MTYYINSDTGNDTTGNGSSSLPWLTMSKAHTSATTGDTIILQQATAVYTFPALTIGKSLAWIAENIGDAVVDGTAGAASWTLGVYSLTLENLIFQNVTTSALAMFYAANTASRTILFKSCIFRNIALGVANNNAAIYCHLAPSSQVTINVNFIGCSFEDIHTPHSGIDSQIATISNNSSANGSVINFGILNCSIILEDTASPLKQFVQLIYPAAGDVLTIDNSILHNNTGSTVNFAKYYGSSASTYRRVENSAFVNVTSPPDAFTNGIGNTTSAPSYVDSANGDYRLQPSSVGSFEGRLI